ncbi:MAG: hypothetical protein IPK10_08030 [Bacteroidetes bacterium]|nr:hypothetical protein [Bacteroidota bacterium]
MWNISVKFNGQEAKEFDLDFLKGEIYERMFEHSRINLSLKLNPSVNLLSWYQNTLPSLINSTVQVDFSDGINYQARIVKINSNKGNANTESQIFFNCVSDSLQFDSVIGSDCFVEQPLSDVFSFCSKGLIRVDDSTKITSFRYNETGFNFIKRIAHEQGFWLYLSNNQWVCRKDLSDSKPLQLSGTEVSIGMTFNRGFNSVKTKAYDVARNSTDESQKQAPPLSSNPLKNVLAAFAAKDSPRKLMHPKMPVNKQIQDDHSATLANRLYANMYFMNVETKEEELCLGKLFSIDDLGDYRIVEISHYFSSQSYGNSVVSIPIEHKAAPGSFTSEFIKPRIPILGGVVTEIGTGKNTGFVKVQYDGVKGISPFVKVLGASAGTNRRIYFLPEMNDRVLIGFTDAHPDMPFIISSHYDGQNKPEIDGNTIKRIKTPSDLLISFNDDKNKNEIIISSKDGQNKIAISHTGNKITVESKNGEVMVTGKTINIKADNELNLKAPEIKIEGTNVEIKGDALTVIKGGIIKLN